MKPWLKIGLILTGLVFVYFSCFGILPIILDSPEVFHPSVLDLPITKPIHFGQSHHIELVRQIGGNNSGNTTSVAFEGSKVLISKLDGSLYILSVSEPSQPYVVGSSKLPADSVVICVKMQGNFVYLGMKDGLHVLDISDSANPTTVFIYKTMGWLQHIAVNNTRAYLVDKNDGLYILDITNPAHPNLLGYYKTINGINFIKDIAIAGKYVYLVAKAIHIMDMSNPSNIKEAGSFTPYYGFDDDNGKEKIAVYENIAFLNEGYKKSFDPVFMSYLTILDISNPTKPTYIVSYNWCRECTIGGSSPDFLYLLMNNELHLVDFSSPRDLIDLGYFGLPSENIYEWYANIGKENTIYVVDDQSNFYSLQYTP